MADVVLQKIYETLHAHRIAALAIEQADTRIEKHGAGGREKAPLLLMTSASKPCEMHPASTKASSWQEMNENGI